MIGRVYIFGSRVRAIAGPDSDFDIALELIESDEDKALDIWVIESQIWNAELEGFLPWKVDLQFYHPKASPKIVKYVADSGGEIYRAPGIEGRSTIDAASATGNGNENLLFSQGGAFSTGIPEIDEDHEALFVLLSDLEKSMDPHRSFDEVRECMAAMSEAILSHLNNEEQILDRRRIPEMEEHKTEHRRLRHELSAIERHVNERERGWRQKVFDLETILERHIMSFDMMFRAARSAGKS